DALSPIHAPQDSDDDSATEGIAPATSDVGETLLARKAITDEQLATAQRVLKQSPGRHIGSVLLELGVDEVAVQQVVAEINRIPFERIDPNNPDAYDPRSMHRLTPDYCKTNCVLPLRREGNRLVVGTASPDDVFLLDEVKRRLGVP